MRDVDLVMRYGVATHESAAMDAARKAHCLCRSCARLKPGTRENCPMAEVLFALCTTRGMAMGVSRCQDWRARPLDPERRAQLVALIADGTLSRQGAEKVKEAMIFSDLDPKTLADQLGVLQC